MLAYRVHGEPLSKGKSLVAKDPTAKRSISSHVNCGSKEGYTSQYISLSKNSLWALYFFSKVRHVHEGASSTPAIVAVDLARVESKVYDLTVEEVRVKELPGATMKNYAKSASEVLVEICIQPEAIVKITTLDSNDPLVKRLLLLQGKGRTIKGTGDLKFEPFSNWMEAFALEFNEREQRALFRMIRPAKVAAAAAAAAAGAAVDYDQSESDDEHDDEATDELPPGHTPERKDRRTAPPGITPPRSADDAGLCRHLRRRGWGNKHGHGAKCLDCGAEVGTLIKDDSAPAKTTPSSPPTPLTGKSSCAHANRKRWGNQHGKGVKCVDCGLELTAAAAKSDAVRRLDYSATSKPEPTIAAAAAAASTTSTKSTHTAPKSTPAVVVCHHPSTRAWKNQHGSGVRCTACDAELSASITKAPATSAAAAGAHCAHKNTRRWGNGSGSGTKCTDCGAELGKT